MKDELNQGSMNLRSLKSQIQKASDHEKSTTNAFSFDGFSEHKGRGIQLGQLWISGEKSSKTSETKVTNQQSEVQGDANPLFVSVIIPTFNRAQMIGITLQSFIDQNYPSQCFEIIVVDNNSKDDTPAVITSFEKNGKVNIRYVFEERQGVHFARNKAAHLAQGEILYFTDDDMIADPSLLSEILKPFLMDPSVGVATGRVFPKWEVEPPSWILSQCQNYLLSLSDKGSGIRIENRDVGVFSCHQAIRKEAFFATEGFHPENTAGEWIGDGETGLCITLLEKGWKFAYNGESITHHMIPPSRLTQDYLNKRLANQGNCDSYTEYRKYRWSDVQIPERAKIYQSEIQKSLTQYQVYKMSQDERWHKEFARVHYWMARLEYDFRIVQDPDWKALVLKNDWLLNP